VNAQARFEVALKLLYSRKTGIAKIFCKNEKEGETFVRVLDILVLWALLASLCLPALTDAAPAFNRAEWEKTVAAAKKEGKVVILGPAGADIRDAFTRGFQKKYPEIEVDFSGMSGSQVAPRLLAELGARKYVTDVVIAGTTTAVGALMPANAIVPLQPFLAGSESHDLSKWRDGKFDFSDKAGQYNLVYGNRIQVAFVYNPTLVGRGKIRSWKDFLNPEWRDKIAMRDPRRAGAALGWATVWYSAPGFGKDFLRQLFGTQQIFISNDERQLLDFVARGRHPLAIGPSGVLAFEYNSKGLPVELFGSADLDEGGVLSASNGTLMVPRNSPHPNATKVYIDYLLSREGQTLWSKASGLTSRRRDVPTDHIPGVLVPKEGVNYMDDYKEDFVNLRDEVVGFLNTLLTR
jgi:ABC-type Fe3+ transport system substrate-binding protein